MKNLPLKLQYILGLIFLLILITDKLNAQIGKREFHYHAFQNVSGDSANDFHLVAIPGGGFKAIGVRFPKDGGGVPAFPHKDFGGVLVSPAGWSSSENHIEIPPGGKMDVCIEGNSPDYKKCYFTKNGDSLHTKRTEIYYEIVPSNPFSSSGNIRIENRGGTPIGLIDIIANVDNISDPFSGTFNPTGTQVPGIPSFLIINPGDSLDFPYVSIDIYKFVSIRGRSFELFDQNNTFEDGAVLTFTPPLLQPDSISASPNPACLGDTVTLVAHGGSLGVGGVIKWYQGSCGSGVSVATGDSIKVIVTSLGMTNYFARVETFNDSTNCVSIALTVDNCCIIPGTPVIAGTTSLCVSLGNIPIQIFATASNASFYAWTPPPGTTIISGQGTSNIILNFTTTELNKGIIGNVCVTVSNQCGSSPTTCKQVDYNSVIPVTPPSISGPAKVCKGDNVVYSIAPVARASSYMWSMPAGMSITNGAGSNIISVSVDSLYNQGILRVAATNSCGTGNQRSKTMLFNTPGTPVQITGPFDGDCANTNVNSIAPVPNANSYVWSNPPGSTLVSGQGTTSATISYPNNFTSGILSVYAVNSCGNGTPRSATVKGAPSTPGIISGNKNVCTGSTEHYSIATVVNTTSYNWTAPGTIITGQGTKEIDVLYGAVPTANQIITVTASNDCGTSNIRILNMITITNCVRDGKFEDEKVICYPNPVNNEIIVVFGKDIYANSISLTDNLGRVVFNKNIATDKFDSSINLNVSNISSGIYSLRIDAGTEIIIRKIVIER
jgi:PKD-like domain/Secretion system C-terminal sorting domain